MTTYTKKDIQTKKYQYIELLDQLKLEYPDMIYESIVGANLMKIDNSLIFESLHEFPCEVEGIQFRSVYLPFEILHVNNQQALDPTESLIDIAQKVIDLKIHRLPFASLFVDKIASSLSGESMTDQPKSVADLFKNKKKNVEFEIKENEYSYVDISEALRNKFDGLIAKDMGAISFAEIHGLPLIQKDYSSREIEEGGVSLSFCETVQDFYDLDTPVFAYGVAFNANQFVKKNIFEVYHLTRWGVFDDEIELHLSAAEERFFDGYPTRNNEIGATEEDIEQYTANLPNLIASLVSTTDDQYFDLLPALQIFYSGKLHENIEEVYLQRTKENEIELVIKGKDGRIEIEGNENWGTYYPDENEDYFYYNQSLKNNAIKFLYQDDLFKVQLLGHFFTSNYVNEVYKKHNY